MRNNRAAHKTAVLIFVLIFPAFLVLVPIAKAEETATEGNKYPIVFIHGAGGFEQGELGGLVNYWGITHDILKTLRDNGYEVYEIKVGPLSSIWDRAVDAFYDIKGGLKDYGKVHSEEFAHRQTSRTLEGKYPQWGEIAEDGTINKVHIIGHSMGGQTARALVELLGMIDPAQGDSRLFNEDLSDWVASVTSISTTHDGTTLVPIMKKLLNEVLTAITEVDLPYDKFISPLLAVAGMITGENPLYDLMLDHFTLAPYENEDVWAYLKRAIISGFKWYDSKDFAIWDASPQGAKELNEWITADPDVYYFSYSTSATRKLPIVSNHIPKLTMLPLLFPMAAMMGSWKTDDGTVDINGDWYENDGVVNTISMNGPKLGSSDEIVNFNENNIQPGVWNYMGKLNWDHMQVVGLYSDWNEVKSFYLNHAAFLASLPGEQPNQVVIDSLIQENIASINDNLDTSIANSDETEDPYTDPATYENGAVEPIDLDSDLDGMVNTWEEKNQLNQNDASDSAVDLDDDGLSNQQEYYFKTAPSLADTDSDEITDSYEVKNSLNPNVADSGLDYDNDGLNNKKEIQIGSDPWDTNTDGDDYTDEEEVQAGSIPTDANSVPFHIIDKSGKVDFDYLTPIVVIFSFWLAGITATLFVLYKTDVLSKLKYKLEPTGRKLSASGRKMKSKLGDLRLSRQAKKAEFDRVLKDIEKDDFDN